MIIPWRNLSPCDLMPEAFMEKEEDDLDDKEDTGQSNTGRETLQIPVGDEDRENVREALPT